MSLFESTDNVELQLFDDNDDETNGPNIRLNRNSATAADNDLLGRVIFSGDNDAQETIGMAEIRAASLDVTDGSEDGQLTVHVFIAGAETEEWRIEAGMYNPNATGAAQGTGTINAKGLFDDGNLTADFVFDRYFQEDVEYPTAVQVRNKMLSDDHFDPKTYAQHWKEYRRLPGMPDGDAVINGRAMMPIGELASRLLETCELQAIHIEELRCSIESLRADLVG